MKICKTVLVVIGTLLIIGMLVNTGYTTVKLSALFMEQASYSVENVKDMTAEFKKEHPDVDVELTFVPWEALHDKIVVSGAAGVSVYDVVLGDCIWPREFAAAGFVSDVTGKLSKQEIADIYMPALKSVMSDDRVYGMPWINDMEFLFYNKKLLASAGFAEGPKTMSQLYDQARRIKAADIVKYPIIEMFTQEENLVCQFANYLGAFGGQFFDANNNPIFHQESGLKALKFMVKGIKEEVINPASLESGCEEVRRVFSEGKGVFGFNWTYMYHLANDPEKSLIAGNAVISLVPGSDDIRSASVYGGMGLHIMANTEHPEEAWAYMRFMASKKTQAKYAALSPPIWKSLYQDPKIIAQEPVIIPITGQQMNYLIHRPQVPWYSAASHVLQEEIFAALAMRKSPERALDDAAARCRALKK